MNSNSTMQFLNAVTMCLKTKMLDDEKMQEVTLCLLRAKVN